MSLDQTLARLAAVRPGIHAERPADRAGDAVKEIEAAKALFQREGGKPLVGQRGAGADAVAGLGAACPKPFAERRMVTPSMPASRTRRFEPTPMTVTGMLDRVLQGRRKVVGVRRLEQKLGRTADPEPGEGRQRRILVIRPRTSEKSPRR